MRGVSIAAGEEIYVEGFAGKRFHLADGVGDLVGREVGGSEGAQAAGVGDGGSEFGRGGAAA
jgi:hypothetical protein